jgi:hypothetical protein
LLPPLPAALHLQQVAAGCLREPHILACRFTLLLSVALLTLCFSSRATLPPRNSKATCSSSFLHQSQRSLTQIDDCLFFDLESSPAFKKKRIVYHCILPLQVHVAQSLAPSPHVQRVNTYIATPWSAAETNQFSPLELPLVGYCYLQ